MVSDRLTIGLATLLLLSGCGVDGPPEAPAPRTDPPQASGLTVSGTAEIGAIGRR